MSKFDISSRTTKFDHSTVDPVDLVEDVVVFDFLWGNLGRLWSRLSYGVVPKRTLSTLSVGQSKLSFWAVPERTLTDVVDPVDPVDLLVEDVDVFDLLMG